MREGDTLASVAAQLWGDSSLWYKLAEANGLSGVAGLIAGQTLSVPVDVMRSGHSAATFQPYDPSEAVGRVSPTSPKPNKSNKCGAFGAVLLSVVAVAVSALTYGALTGPATGLLASIGAGAVSGAAGSIASQGVGLATGMQDQFSWKGVAMAGLSGAVGGGLGQAIKGGGFLAGAARGALGSALTQGVGVATGLQSKFDFAGVAAAGLGGGTASALAGGPGQSFGASLAANTAGGIANAAVRSLIEGTSFGDNIMAALPDVIGSTIGNAAARALAVSGGAGGGRGTSANASETAAEAGSGELIVNEAAVMAAIDGGLASELSLEVDLMMIEFERTTSLDWEGSPAQARHSAIREQVHAQIMEQLGVSTELPLEFRGLRDDPALPAMPMEIVSPTLSLTVLNEWVARYDATWQANLGKFDPFNDRLTRASYAANREYIHYLDRVADAQLARDLRDFGSIYYDVASTVIAPLGAADTAYQILSGNMTATEAAITVATMGRGRAMRAVEGRMFSSGKLMGIERASPELIAAVGSRRSVVIASPGSDELRMLDYFGAEASVNTTVNGVRNGSIVLRENPSRAAVLEEFLHGTQARLGIIDRLGERGLGSAETHVKDFMIRHQRMLGLSNEDTAILRLLRDRGL